MTDLEQFASYAEVIIQPFVADGLRDAEAALTRHVESTGADMCDVLNALRRLQNAPEGVVGDAFMVANYAARVRYRPSVKTSHELCYKQWKQGAGRKQADRERRQSRAAELRAEHPDASPRWVARQIRAEESQQFGKAPRLQTIVDDLHENCALRV